jgi:hypothetical protein
MRTRPLLLAAILSACLGTEPAAAVLSGVCPDGSMFIVKKESDIPCRAAKLVDPQEMPPVRPEYLPRPYGWQVFHEKQDPNNPYNLIEDSRTVGDVEPTPDAMDTRASASPRGEPQAATAPPVSAPPPPAVWQLTTDEKRDLTLIVELTQQRAPATFRVGPRGNEPLVVRLAHSRAFEARLRELWTQRGQPLSGPAVLFTVQASGAGAFHGNFTFAQGHMAYHPQRNDPRQLGILDGQLGSLAAGGAILGYVVLPADADLSQPMDVYWNDRRLAATLRP